MGVHLAPLSPVQDALHSAEAIGGHCEQFGTLALLAGGVDMAMSVIASTPRARINKGESPLPLF